uniref:Follistatin-like domain-containing protein n=1 Tax=Pristionchus pacificus TaxID=54126 RepID=A0A8R1YKU0_PRIPA
MIFLVLLITFTFSSSAIAQTCTGFKCPTGKRCEMQIESCPVPPCVPLPTCVVNITACVLPCSIGESCVWESVLCEMEPCYPIQVCKTDQTGFRKSCEGIYCRGDMKCVLRKGVPVCIKSKGSSNFPMGTMPPTVTCKTLGCPPGERCVQKSYGPQCEAVDCGYHAEYDRCFNGCEATCQNFGPLCDKKCGPGGCRCKMGYYRTPEGACEMECPRAFGGF